MSTDCDVPMHVLGVFENRAVTKFAFARGPAGKDNTNVLYRVLAREMASPNMTKFRVRDHEGETNELVLPDTMIVWVTRDESGLRDDDSAALPDTFTMGTQTFKRVTALAVGDLVLDVYSDLMVVRSIGASHNIPDGPLPVCCGKLVKVGTNVIGEYRWLADSYKVFCGRITELPTELQTRVETAKPPTKPAETASSGRSLVASTLLEAILTGTNTTSRTRGA
jgi:hypothetical protein